MKANFLLEISKKKDIPPETVEVIDFRNDYPLIRSSFKNPNFFCFTKDLKGFISKHDHSKTNKF